MSSVVNATALRRFQSDVVLRLARLTFLIGAALALLVIVGALLYAAALQLKLFGGPETVPVPAAYQPSSPVIGLEWIESRLSPPRNLTFVVTRDTIVDPVSQGEFVGYFQAVTLNGLASFPDSFDILGGRDSHLFQRVRHSQSGVGLAMTPALAEQINKARESVQSTETLSFEIKVVARDAYGNYSTPHDLTFALRFGPSVRRAPAEPAIAAPQPQPQALPERPTEIQKLAREIALLLDPGQTLRFYDFYRRALDVPRICGASDASADFLASFRRAFDAAKPKLTSSTIEPFYKGLCESWQQTLSQQEADRNRVESARLLAIQQNLAYERQHRIEQLETWAQRNFTLMVAGGAFVIFLIVGLLLALLAIENHSKALREAAEALLTSRTSPNILAESGSDSREIGLPASP